MRVEEESESARLETLTLPVELMGAQESGLGREASANVVQDSAIRDWAPLMSWRMGLLRQARPWAQKMRGGLVGLSCKIHL